MNALGYEDYQRLSEGGRPVPVFRELPGDLRTPVSAFLSLASRSERAFLLESVLGGERLARYSFLGREPVARLEVRVAFDKAREHARSVVGDAECQKPRLVFRHDRARGGSAPGRLDYLLAPVCRVYGTGAQSHHNSIAPIRQLAALL